MLARVRRTVQDTELEISDAMLDQAIDDAVEVYSKDVPRKTVVDVSGNGTSIYLILTILPGYIDGYSVLDKIEYPLTGTSPPTLPPHCYEIQRRPDGNGNPALYLVFVGGQRPASSSSFRVVYTIMHLSDCSTIVASDRIAVSYLSAAHALDLYATATMDSIDSSIDADVFDRTATTERARRAAKMYRDLYREMVGVDDNDDGGRREVPANTTISWSRRRRTHEQPPYLTH
ncbi:MAG: hypothetical protein F4180_04570 [Chloroflexi bacterium]|nr:hypothetical protein [Chloroflexota bacterium]